MSDPFLCLTPLPALWELRPQGEGSSGSLHVRDVALVAAPGTESPWLAGLHDTGGLQRYPWERPRGPAWLLWGHQESLTMDLPGGPGVQGPAKGTTSTPVGRFTTLQVLAKRVCLPMRHTVSSGFLLCVCPSHFYISVILNFENCAHVTSTTTTGNRHQMKAFTSMSSWPRDVE